MPVKDSTVFNSFRLHKAGTNPEQEQIWNGFKKKQKQTKVKGFIISYIESKAEFDEAFKEDFLLKDQLFHLPIES